MTKQMRMDKVTSKVTNFDRLFDKMYTGTCWILIVGFITLFWFYFYSLFIG